MPIMPSLKGELPASSVSRQPQTLPMLCTYFCIATAWAPGHKLELTTATAYCGTILEESLALHAGIPLTAVFKNKGLWHCALC